MAATVTPSAADFDTQPYIQKHKFRGRLYEFRELTIGEYDKLVKMATIEREDAAGEKQEFVDNGLLNKLLVQASVGIPLAEQTSNGVRLMSNIQRITQELHFGSEPDELTEPSEGDTSGN